MLARNRHAVLSDLSSNLIHLCSTMIEEKTQLLALFSYAYEGLKISNHKIWLVIFII